MLGIKIKANKNSALFFLARRMLCFRDKVKYMELNIYFSNLHFGEISNAA